MNPQLIGKNVNSVIGCEPIGIKIFPAGEADAVLKKTKPSARKTVSTQFSHARNSSIFGILRRILRKNWIFSQRRMTVHSAAAATRIFSGGQWLQIFVASCAHITKIKGSSSYRIMESRWRRVMVPDFLWRNLKKICISKLSVWQSRQEMLQECPRL